MEQVVGGAARVFFVCCEQASTSAFLNVGCDHAHGQDHWENESMVSPGTQEAKIKVIAMQCGRRTCRGNSMLR